MRGTGEARDTLDLMTGEVEKNVGEIVLDGTQSIYSERPTYLRYYIKLYDMKKLQDYSTRMKCDKINVSNNHTDLTTTETTLITGHVDVNNQYPNQNWVYFNIEGIETVDRMREYLKVNPITVQYPLAENSVRIVALDSTYYFQPVMNREVRVEGMILPLVCSVTVPTDPLTFVLNPNESDDRQFVAPEFAIVNETKASIDLALKQFEQTTDVMNDVLPDTHETWQDLNREQSKDIALALVPKSGEGWLNLEEGPRYVAEDSNYYLGEVKAESSVDFTFIASHGRAFVEPIDPKYRLSFVFDFR